MGGNLIGPSLDSIRGRRSDKWIITFLKNSQKFKNDRYLIKLKKQFNNIPHPKCENSEEQIKMILDYLDNSKYGIPDILPSKKSTGN
jgi:hypothetical protein